MGTIMSSNDPIEFGRSPSEPGDGEARRGAKPMSWGDREDRRRAQRLVGMWGVCTRWARGVGARVGRVSRSVGLSHRKIVVDGVVYRERNSVSLKRSLSGFGGGAGDGVKEYDVRFSGLGMPKASLQYPFRETMRIRCTNKRVYQDLSSDPRLGFLDAYRALVRPGMRVLDLGCGTGALSGELAGLVGPSGAVVGIHRDGESVRFARQRYRHDHLAYELGWIESLEGELDRSFGVVIATDALRDAADEPSKSRAVSGLWRLVEDGGTMVAVCSRGYRLLEVSERIEASGGELVEMLEGDGTRGWRGAVFAKPGVGEKAVGNGE